MRSFSRAGESLFVGNKLEFVESIFRITPLFSDSQRAISKRIQRPFHRVREELRTRAGEGRRLVVVALLADGKRDGKAVARRR